MFIVEFLQMKLPSENAKGQKTFILLRQNCCVINILLAAIREVN